MLGAVVVQDPTTQITPRQATIAGWCLLALVAALALLPLDLDTVVIQEDARAEGQRVTLPAARSRTTRRAVTLARWGCCVRPSR